MDSSSFILQNDGDAPLFLLVYTESGELSHLMEATL